jgi:PBSX family phage portal protein
MSDQERSNVEKRAEATVRTPVLKLISVGPDRTTRELTNAIDEESSRKAFMEAGALPAPYNLRTLCEVFECSAALRPNVDAMAANVDGNGHHFVPMLDVEADDALDRVAEAIYIERLAARERGQVVPTIVPTQAEAEERLQEIEDAMRLERFRLEQFFERCVVDESFVSLRKKTRQDLEVTGNAFWEVLRDSRGEVAQFSHLQSYTMRLLPQQREFVEITIPVRVSPLAMGTERVRRRFRKFLQVIEMKRVIFKEFGDPRTISSNTGKVYDSPDALRSKEPGVPEATEVLHFKIYSPTTPYGVPRWIGNLFNVLGATQADEVNFLYFENKSVPPMALLVSGGRVSEDSAKYLEDFIENEIKGKRNFHKILIIEAEPTGGDSPDGLATGKMKLELKPLTAAQHSDALFQKYDERAFDKIGMSWRLPRLIRGDVRDFNRACYSDDTEVLTPGGWKRHDELAPDAVIAQVEPQTGIVVFEAARGLHSYPYDGQMVRLVGPGTDVLVTPDHKMLVRTKGGAWDAPKAEELIGRRKTTVRVAASGFEGASPADFVLPKTCQIERGHDHEAIPFARFVEFLGYFCSDGGTLDTEHPSAPYLVFLRQKKVRTLERMRACLAELGWAFSETQKVDGTVVMTISNRCLRDWLRRCGVGQLGRLLPAEILERLDARTARILFDALMAGDGSWDARENRTSGSYYTGSPVLAGQVQMLATLLGMRSTVAWSTGGGVFRVSLSRREVATVADGAEFVPYVGNVHCFSTRTGFYVTRRNGRVAYQGNTAEAAVEFAETQVFGPERTEFDFQINRVVLGTLGTRYFKFQSNAVLLRDPKVLAQVIAQLTSSNVLVPADGRALAADLVFNRPLAKIESDWVYQPVMLSQVGIPLDTKIDGKIPGLSELTVPNPPQEPSGPGGGNAPAPGATAPRSALPGGGKAWGYGGARRNRKAAEASVLQLVRELVQTRDALVKLEEESAAKAHADASKSDAQELEVVRITMPAEEIRKRFRIVPT